jgi:hypothetical protein
VARELDTVITWHSPRSAKRASCWPSGGTTTIASGRARRSPTGHRKSSATTPRPLPQRPTTGKSK